ncbi:hypothetical protein JI534_14705, partial [Listeria monocytogenes]|nr:hypothetical protein [Listeria monocytogenes]
AYTYGYVVFGELIGWLLGWALILEYGLAVASVASGWSSYLNACYHFYYALNLLSVFF